MSLVSRDPILLTPGPLTTSLPTKAAMLRDWGSWDASFNAITARVRGRLLAVANAEGTHVCVPMQGSGTFSVEAAVNTLVPRDGHLLVLINGAYGHRMAKLATMMGRRVTTFVTADDVPTTPADVDRLLAADGSITHVGLIHCETSTGIHNPLEAIAEVVAHHGRRLLIDAMSSFGALAIDARRVAFDALVAASGKCIEGPPGMGFVIARREPLERAAGNSTSLALDLHDQWAYMEKTTQWRYTPPTHVVAAFDAALEQFVAEGGQPARLARYTRNCEALVGGMARAGLPAVSRSGDPGADHRHLPRARRSALRVQGVLREGARPRLHPLSGQADRGGDVPRGLHRGDRPRGDAAGGTRDRGRARGPRHPRHRQARAGGAGRLRRPTARPNGAAGPASCSRCVVRRSATACVMPSCFCQKSPVPRCPPGEGELTE